jgi:hypothetical protein
MTEIGARIMPYPAPQEHPADKEGSPTVSEPFFSANNIVELPVDLECLPVRDCIIVGVGILAHGCPPSPVKCGARPSEQGSQIF